MDPSKKAGEGGAGGPLKSPKQQKISLLDPKRGLLLSLFYIFVSLKIIHYFFFSPKYVYYVVSLQKIYLPANQRGYPNVCLFYPPPLPSLFPLSPSLPSSHGILLNRVDLNILTLDNLLCLKTYCPEPEEVFILIFFLVLVLGFLLFFSSFSPPIFLFFLIRSLFAKNLREMLPFWDNQSFLFAVLARFFSFFSLPFLSLFSQQLLL